MRDPMRVLFLILALAACGDARLDEPAEVGSISWSDGDSGTMDGDRFRLANVDAPEIGNPECEAERKRGREAMRAVRQMTGRGRVVIQREYETDRYDRRVVDLYVDGEDLAQTLMERGLAKPWPHRDGRALRAKPDWC